MHRFSWREPTDNTSRARGLVPGSSPPFGSVDAALDVALAAPLGPSQPEPQGDFRHLGPELPCVLPFLLTRWAIARRSADGGRAVGGSLVFEDRRLLPR